MNSPQLPVVVATLSGLSLFLHLCSAGNFVPDSEMYFFGAYLTHLHSICNLFARVSLLSVIIITIVDLHFPNMLSFMQTDGQVLSKYLSQLILTAFLCMAIRFVLPGPVTYYSRFYKIGVFLSFAASVISILDAKSNERLVCAGAAVQTVQVYCEEGQYYCCL